LQFGGGGVTPSPSVSASPPSPPQVMYQVVSIDLAAPLLATFSPTLNCIEPGTHYVFNFTGVPFHWYLPANYQYHGSNMIEFTTPENPTEDFIAYGIDNELNNAHLYYCDHLPPPSPPSTPSLSPPSLSTTLADSSSSTVTSGTRISVLYQIDDVQYAQGLLGCSFHTTVQNYSASVTLTKLIH